MAEPQPLASPSRRPSGTRCTRTSEMRPCLLPDRRPAASEIHWPRGARPRRPRLRTAATRSPVLVKRFAYFTSSAKFLSWLGQASVSHKLEACVQCREKEQHENQVSSPERFLD